MKLSACIDGKKECNVTAKAGVCSRSTMSGAGGLCAACEVLKCIASSLQMSFAWDMLLTAVHNQELPFWRCQESRNYGQEGG